jgi:hypothetical protein
MSIFLMAIAQNGKREKEASIDIHASTAMTYAIF